MDLSVCTANRLPLVIYTIHTINEITFERTLESRLREYFSDIRDIMNVTDVHEPDGDRALRVCDCSFRLHTLLFSTHLGP
jgi:hypothetical protein